MHRCYWCFFQYPSNEYFTFDAENVHILCTIYISITVDENVPNDTCNRHIEIERKQKLVLNTHVANQNGFGE